MNTDKLLTSLRHVFSCVSYEEARKIANDVIGWGGLASTSELAVKTVLTYPKEMLTYHEEVLGYNSHLLYYERCLLRFLINEALDLFYN